LQFKKENTADTVFYGAPDWELACGKFSGTPNLLIMSQLLFVSTWHHRRCT